ncbi:hypothetical protein [Streptomyces blattellae]|uniref:hypothetical protein n=1 Tax=Streptomyces blattellae TaxID=2569855 RepID=UPI0012B98B58|nr:hypothetical protein [Streptomyces blattellae]
MSEPITFGRPFVLRRDRDLSGVSGTGIIADGILFPDGQAAIHWRGKWALTTPHPSMESITDIHDHGGQGDLHVIWADEDTIPVADHLDAAERAQQEIERLRGVAGRAYLLADRWEAAHGASQFLVRVAGAELRDVLNDDQADAPAAADTMAPATTCSARYTGVLPVGDCIRAAGHIPVTDHTDDRGRSWGDRLAEYPVDNGRALSPPDGGIAEDGLRRRCEELQARLGDAEDRVHTAVRNAEEADRFRAEEQRDRDQHAAVLREVLGSFRQVSNEGVTHEGEILGFVGPTVTPEDYARWCTTVAPTVERPWWETVAELRAELQRYTEAESADAAAGSYAGRAEQAEAAIERVRGVVADARKWALPGSQLASYVKKTEEALSDTRLGATDSQACPYCTGGPQFLRSELGAHVEDKHARVLAALASGGSLDEQLAAPETRCTLPHEMEA